MNLLLSFIALYPNRFYSSCRYSVFVPVNRKAGTTSSFFSCVVVSSELSECVDGNNLSSNAFKVSLQLLQSNFRNVDLCEKILLPALFNLPVIQLNILIVRHNGTSITMR